jgi:hypothetical protein
LACLEEVTPAAKPALPAYPQADFDKNLPAWTKAVADGKKTAHSRLMPIRTACASLMLETM